ncbi:hypothetical protein GJ496_009155 [Pomphorhynchus laevis]|nr:hypothetical protein GJ496_009155 [Pomphorhynchus laevis]
MPFNYPNVRRDISTIDKYHGVEVPDPYQWLEDPDSGEVKQFVEDQCMVFDQYFKDLNSQYEKIKERMTELFKFKRFACPVPFDGRYFLIKNTGLQNQDVCSISSKFDDLDGEEFLDPNKLSVDGTIALAGLSISFDNRIIAYALSEAGSDWRTIYFKQASKGFPSIIDVLERVKFSNFKWTVDNLGGFYSTYDVEDKADGTETTKNEFCKTYYHKMGTSQKDDMLVLNFPTSPGLIGSIECTGDGRYLVATIRYGCKVENCIWIYDISIHGSTFNSEMKWLKLFEDDKYIFTFITNSDRTFYFLSNHGGADRYKIIAVDIQKPCCEMIQTIIEEDKEDVIDNCICVGDKKYMIVVKTHDVKNIICVYKRDPCELLKTLNVGISTVSSISYRSNESEVFYCITSFLSSAIIYRIQTNSDNLEPELFYKTNFPALDTDLLTAKQFFFRSSTEPSVRIPMYVVHRKDIQMNSDNPTILYGYGGFGVSLMPTFSISRVQLIHDYNIVLAIANIRGGGEYGEDWHRRGRVLQKKNSFQDFCDAAEFLIKEKYTNSNRLAINGGSNGGLLVAACANLKPNLFKLVVPEVGVMDMLKFHNWTIGNAWISDYGCSDDEKQFHYIYTYSPLHNIPSNGSFPAILCTTADHDDRVVPAHTFKYIAELQYKLGLKSGQVNPLLAYIETKAGHGSGKPISKRIESFSKIAAVICHELNATATDECKNLHAHFFQFSPCTQTYLYTNIDHILTSAYESEYSSDDVKETQFVGTLNGIDFECFTVKNGVGEQGYYYCFVRANIDTNLHKPHKGYRLLEIDGKSLYSFSITEFNSFILRNKNKPLTMLLSWCPEDYINLKILVSTEIQCSNPMKSILHDIQFDDGLNVYSLLCDNILKILAFDIVDNYQMFEMLFTDIDCILKSRKSLPVCDVSSRELTVKSVVQEITDLIGKEISEYSVSNNGSNTGPIRGCIDYIITSIENSDNILSVTDELDQIFADLKHSNYDVWVENKQSYYNILLYKHENDKEIIQAGKYIENLSKSIQHAGWTLSTEETIRLRKFIIDMGAMNPKLWGKVYGKHNDYLITKVDSENDNDHDFYVLSDSEWIKLTDETIHDLTSILNGNSEQDYKILRYRIDKISSECDLTYTNDKDGSNFLLKDEEGPQQWTELVNKRNQSKRCIAKWNVTNSNEDASYNWQMRSGRNWICFRNIGNWPGACKIIIDKGASENDDNEEEFDLYFGFAVLPQMWNAVAIDSMGLKADSSS